MEIWDDLGWKIASGSIPPKEAHATLQAALLSTKTVAEGTSEDAAASSYSSTPPPPPPRLLFPVTCVLDSGGGCVNRGRGSVKSSRATFGVKVFACGGGGGGGGGGDHGCIVLSTHYNIVYLKKKN